MNWGARRLSHVILAAAVLAVQTSEAALGAPALEEQKLVARVSTLYKAHLEAIRAVECDYTFFLDTMERRCRYVRDGEKYYHASVDLYDNGARGLARENAWDGQVSNCRRNAEYLTRSRSKEDAQPACDTPERAIRNFLDEALGVSARKDHAYRLHSAKLVGEKDDEYVELDFAADWSGGRLISRHARSVGYLPVSVKYFDQTGQMSYEMSHVEYDTKAVAGNRLHYPVLILQKAYANGVAEDLMRYEVDRATLKINQKHPESRFVLEPWPSDLVVDLDTLKETRPTDPNWSPKGKLGFPYDVLFARGFHRREASGAPQHGEPIQESSKRGRGNASAEAAAALPEERRDGEAQLLWVAVGGVALTGFGTWLVWRSRRQGR